MQCTCYAIRGDKIRGDKIRGDKIREEGIVKGRLGKWILVHWYKRGGISSACWKTTKVQDT
jgi:hypothetical protein